MYAVTVLDSSDRSVKRTMDQYSKTVHSLYTAFSDELQTLGHIDEVTHLPTVLYDFLEDQSTVLLLSSSDKVGCGMCTFREEGDQSVGLGNIFIDAESRRQGYGTALLQHAETVIRGLDNIDTIYLYHYGDGTARDLYLKLGYVELDNNIMTKGL